MADTMELKVNVYVDKSDKAMETYHAIKVT